MKSDPTCRICGEQVDIMVLHLKRDHGLNENEVKDYFDKYPEDPKMSQKALKSAAEMKKKKSQKGTSVPLTDLFQIEGDGLTKRGKPLMIEVLDAPEELSHMVPRFDTNFVFDEEILKTCLMTLALNMRGYLFGHSGVGKSTIWENICAKTNRPMVRVQHSINVEEIHVTGQWLAAPVETPDGSVITVTKFQPGPLAEAMRKGLVYVADEYDRIHPTVASVYQAVMEGKPLHIKDADEEWRIVEPHPNFRFVGTGNSNGAGDESGLYQAVVTQDAANFERWDVVQKVEYMPRHAEIQVVMKQANLNKPEAEKVIDFCIAMRQSYPHDISLTPGPRVAIRIGKLGIIKGDFNLAVDLAFGNRLPEAEGEAARLVAQRYFG